MADLNSGNRGAEITEQATGDLVSVAGNGGTGAGDTVGSAWLAVEDATGAPAASTEIGTNKKRGEGAKVRFKIVSPS